MQERKVRNTNGSACLSASPWPSPPTGPPGFQPADRWEPGKETGEGGRRRVCRQMGVGGVASETCCSRHLGAAVPQDQDSREGTGQGQGQLSAPAGPEPAVPLSTSENPAPLSRVFLACPAFSKRDWQWMTKKYKMQQDEYRSEEKQPCSEQSWSREAVHRNVLCVGVYGSQWLQTGL